MAEKDSSLPGASPASFPEDFPADVEKGARPLRLRLEPRRVFAGRLRLPGSKSISNRALLLASLCPGETRLEGMLESEDTSLMRAALEALGVKIQLQDGVWKVQGQQIQPQTVQGQKTQDEGEQAQDGKGQAPTGRTSLGEGSSGAGVKKLFLGNAGTAMRPLLAMLAAGQGEYELGGSPRMHERPIGPLVEALRQLGAEIRCLGMEGFPPLGLKARGLRGKEVVMKGGSLSSQFLSSMLMAGPLVAGSLEQPASAGPPPLGVFLQGSRASMPYVQLTREVMRAFGVEVVQEGDVFFVPRKPYQSPGTYRVEGDASSASYFLAGAAISGGRVREEGMGRASIQGDRVFAELLARMGADLSWGEDWVEIAGKGRLSPLDHDASDIPDAAMTLAMVMLFAQGKSILRGVGSWRYKETDRLKAMAVEMGKLGARVREGQDFLEIEPPLAWQEASICTYDDHRMAMAFSLAACGPEAVQIEDPRCVEKTFPEYFRHFAALTGG